MPNETLPARVGDYYSQPGLSFSGMKHLAVSPLRYWYLFVNPDAPLIKPTPEMQFGSALHCAVLEPSEFNKRYACEFVPPEGCLVTMEDLRDYSRSHGVTPKGTRKADVIAHVRENCSPMPPIFDVLNDAHLRAHEGKILFKQDDWQRLAGCAKALLNEPRVQEILSAGEPEVPIFAADPDTGVLLKGKLDWVRPGLTLDVKTFTQKRSKTITESVNDAIYYEKYYWQAYLYHRLRALRGDGDTDTVLAFVESEPPHEVRLRKLRPKTGPEANNYWLSAALDIQGTNGLIRTYQECVEHFGQKPWKYAAEIEMVSNEDIKQMAWS